jgi:hypothetical protein
MGQLGAVRQQVGIYRIDCSYCFGYGLLLRPMGRSDMAPDPRVPTMVLIEMGYIGSNDVFGLPAQQPDAEEHVIPLHGWIFLVRSGSVFSR